MDQPVIFNFDRGKPFYPLVVNFYAYLYGAKFLSYKPIAEGVQTLTDSEFSQWMTQYSPDTQRELIAAKTAVIGNLIPQLMVPTRTLYGPLKLTSVDFEKEFAANFTDLNTTTVRVAAGGILLLAYEITKDQSDKSPMWEFLFHCRNAAAHNSRFLFKYGHPKHKAEWRGLEITKNLEGTPLFIEDGGSGLLNVGDALVLLYDIETTYL